MPGMGFSWGLSEKKAAKIPSSSKEGDVMFRSLYLFDFYFSEAIPAILISSLDGKPEDGEKRTGVQEANSKLVLSRIYILGNQ